MKGNADYPKFRWLVLLAASMCYFSFSVGALAFPPVLPIIAKDLGIGMAAATNLLSSTLFAAAISLVFGGAVCDRYGIMASLILSSILTLVPMALMPWIGVSYPAVFVARIIQGIGAGFTFCVMSPVISIWFPMHEKGLAAGVMGASVSIGSGIGVIAAPLVLVATGNWQQMVAWLSIPCWISLVITFIAIARRPAPPVRSTPGAALSESGSSYRKALKTPVTWIGVLVSFFGAWHMQSLFNLTPSYFTADKPVGTGFGPVLSGKLMLGVMVAGIVGPMIGGLLQDKVFRGNAKPVMLIGFALAALFTYLIVAPSVYMNIPLLVLCLALAGAGIQFPYTCISVYVAKAYPVSIAAKLLGLWMGLGLFGGAAGVALGGLAVAQFGNYNGAISLGALAAVAGCFFVTMLKKLKDGDTVLQGPERAVQ